MNIIVQVKNNEGGYEGWKNFHVPDNGQFRIFIGTDGEVCEGVAEAGKLIEWNNDPDDLGPKEPTGKPGDRPPSIRVSEAIKREVLALTMNIVAEGLQSDVPMRDAVRSLQYISTLKQVHDVKMDDKKFFNGKLAVVGKEGE